MEKEGAFNAHTEEEELSRDASPLMVEGAAEHAREMVALEHEAFAQLPALDPTRAKYIEAFGTISHMLATAAQHAEHEAKEAAGSQ